MSSGGDMSEKYKHKGVKNIYLPLKKKYFFNIKIEIRFFENYLRVKA